MSAPQKKLNEAQLEAFYSDSFASDQVKHFSALLEGLPLDTRKSVVDVGGGRGYFARAVHAKKNLKVRVLEMDERAIEFCQGLGMEAIEAVHGDALQPPIRGDEGVVCFNLILHHLIAGTESNTRELQRRAISAWKGQAEYIFVNEYVYDSFVGNASGRLIYEITNSKILSFVGKIVSKVVPSLRANTFGVGVRFRAHDEWIKLFEDCGYEVVGKAYGNIERLQLPRRLLLIREKRRDSYLLRERGARNSSSA